MAKTTAKPTQTASTVPAVRETAPAEVVAFDPSMVGMERPDFIAEGDTAGTDNIGLDDVRLPRLAFAQGLSPQLIPGDSKYIDGLRMIEMFNDFTGEIYGLGPLYFVPVRRDVRRIEFRPRTEGGGVVDMDVPVNDPRLLWTTNEETGARVPPKATKFDEFVIFLFRSGGETEPIVLSIKHTNKFNRRAATDLNGYIKMHASKGAKSVPIYGVIYSIESKPEKNDKGTFAVPVVKQVGYLPANAFGKRVFDAAKQFAESLEGKSIVVEREPGDDDLDFPPVEGEVVNRASEM